ncbi:MAG: alpha/beta fold hydrolase [Chloracidobacterium sp.]|nr:alpha/beta fold hydrolase [Chloracidobacterium sp.]MDW8218093.1 alpha/beta fold hydrolase [Acidobacteriota bacterium]
MTTEASRLSAFVEYWQWALDDRLLRIAGTPVLAHAAGWTLDHWLDWVALAGAAAPWHPFTLAQEVRQAALLAAARAVAPPTATTPCAMVPLVGHTWLRRYPPAGVNGRRRKRAPVLIVNSLINRHYIFDLYAGRSFIAYLTAAGQEVFALDWGCPAAAAQAWRLEDVVGVVGRAVEAVGSETGARAVHLLGYSMGGVLATTYAALSPARAASLILLGTPADFTRDAPLRTWLTTPTFKPQRIAEIFGNLPGWLVSASFRSVKPATYATKPWLIWLDAADRETHLAVEVWLADAVPLPGRFYADFVTTYYQDNALWEGKLLVDGQRAALDALDCPVLNIIGSLDQIVHPASAIALAERLPAARYVEYQARLGHLALVVGRGATTTVWSTVRNWLAR